MTNAFSCCRLTNALFVWYHFHEQSFVSSLYAERNFVSIPFPENLFVLCGKQQKEVMYMGFKERLKEKRLEAGFTQVELAEKVSVTPRTIQNYEMGTRRPGNMKIVGDLAAALGTTADYLLTNADVYTLEAQEKGGPKAARDIQELVGEVTGLFAGGQLSEDALEGAMRALNDAYWKAKEKNKKFAPKKHRHPGE